MPYDLRSSKRFKTNEINETKNDEEDSTESDSFIVNDDLKEQALERLLELSESGEAVDLDCMAKSNIYESSHYELPDEYAVEVLNHSKSENCKIFYKEKLKQLRQLQIGNYITLGDILNSLLPDIKKTELLVLYDQLKQYQYYQEEFIVLNLRIKKILDSEQGNVFTDDSCELLLRIKNAHISEANREKLIRRFFALQKCESTEKQELLSNIEYGLKIINEPHSIVIDHNYSNVAQSIKQKLDDILFGQDKAKEEIIDNVISRMVNPNIGNVSVFLGDPGVGKTHTARNLALILGYKFYQISLGAINDSASITGMLSAYVGSRPGEIFNAISEMGCNNGIIFLDEFDKIFDSSKKGSLENTFLNILDPTQNCNFKDTYLYDLNIDLSKIWFIISINDISHIHGPIKDRLKPIITFENYSLENKINILKNFVIPATANLYKIDLTSLHIDESVYKMICSLCTTEGDGGIRDVKNTCELLFKRLNTLILTTYRPSYFVELPRLENGKIYINIDVVKKLLEIKKPVEKFMSFYS